MCYFDKEYYEAFQKSEGETAKYYQVPMYNGGIAIKLYKPSIAELFQKRMGIKFEMMECHESRVSQR